MELIYLHWSSVRLWYTAYTSAAVFCIEARFVSLLMPTLFRCHAYAVSVYKASSRPRDLTTTARWYCVFLVSGKQYRKALIITVVRPRKSLSFCPSKYGIKICVWCVSEFTVWWTVIKRYSPEWHQARRSVTERSACTSPNRLWHTQARQRKMVISGFPWFSIDFRKKPMHVSAGRASCWQSACVTVAVRRSQCQ